MQQASMDAVASTGLGATALSRISGVALADIAGFSMQVIGRSGVLLALSPTQLGDGTLYGQEEVKAKSGVETRVRFGFDTDGNIHGYHVDNAVIPNRTVERIGDKFVVDLEPGIRIEWVPTTTEIAGTKILTNPIPDIDLHTIYIHPEKDQGEEFANTYVTPISDVDLNDYILIFPEETGLPPLYIVYSKPPVKMLEVDLYGNFKGRPRNGTHADHMPSQSAAKLYLKNIFKRNYTVKIGNSKMGEIASIIIPAKVHQKYSETYGRRNTPQQIEKDASNLKQAVNNNFDAIKPWMLEEGFNESELENARSKIHQLNKNKGWYK
ncbi:TPA: S-type pyocin domain-containing protein [Photobacterium damselae]